MYLLHFENRLRQSIVRFTCSDLFENFVILIIFINSVVLAIYDYNDRDNKLPWNQKLEIIGHVLTVLFSIEMTLKILA